MTLKHSRLWIVAGLALSSVFVVDGVASAKPSPTGGLGDRRVHHRKRN